eukprot:TRINITY_DN7921_c2_g1_i2.p1 TRINITY_DN7921_c2_g1~~TRINITY_DN7921_c2_g1_i2.p1  ORF type:complete len:353 (-),score=62.01 TRINITY_DN7921_c2_g1_i2:132-1190(-)
MPRFAELLSDLWGNDDHNSHTDLWGNDSHSSHAVDVGPSSSSVSFVSYAWPSRKGDKFFSPIEESGVFGRQAIRSRQPRASAFAMECLCPIRGHCVPGAKCPQGEHVDPSMCKPERSVEFPPDEAKVRCDEEKAQCKAQCEEMKAECKQPCELLQQRCKDQCQTRSGKNASEKVLKDCEEKCIKHKWDCDPENPVRKRCDRRAEVQCQRPECTQVCELEAVRDLTLERRGAHRVMVKQVREDSDSAAAGVRPGSELLAIDGDDFGWREGGSKDKEELIGNLDWSKPHKFDFRLPDDSDCGTGNLCCSMASTREAREKNFTLNCPNNEVCKDTFTCREDSDGVCSYQVREVED